MGRSNYTPDPHPRSLWVLDAECRWIGPDLFFDQSNGYHIVRPLCARCPVAAECLEEALQAEDGGGGRYGYWGGKTPAQRTQIAKQRNKQMRNREQEQADRNQVRDSGDPVRHRAWVS